MALAFGLALVVLCGAVVTVYRAFAPPPLRVRPRAALSPGRFDAMIRPAVIETPRRSVYPYSVIRGGVFDGRELEIALAADRVAARHYEGFDERRAQPEVLVRDRKAYVSYRLGGRIFWSKRMVVVRKGETVLSDGKNCVRGRCGNRISDKPREPVSAFEPRGINSDTPEFPAPPDIQARFSPGGLGIALTPMLAPEVFSEEFPGAFPGAAAPSSQAGGAGEKPEVFIFIPPWVSSGTVSVPGGPAGGGVIEEIYQPLPVTPTPVGQGFVFQAPGNPNLRIPGAPGVVVPGPAIVAQLLRPATNSRTRSTDSGPGSNPGQPGQPGNPSGPGQPGNPGGSTPSGGSTPPGKPTPPDNPKPPDGPGEPTPPPDLPPVTPPKPEPPVPTPIPEPMTGLSALGAFAVWLACRMRRRRRRERAPTWL